MAVGRPVAVAVSPPFSSTVATPSLNVMLPNLPLMLLSPSVTVKVNTWSASAALSLISSLLSSRSPVLRVFVKAAMLVTSPMVPVFAFQLVVNRSLSVSVTVYSSPFSRPVALLISPLASSKVATPFSNVMSP